MAEIGTYVRGKLVGGNDVRRGVLIHVFKDDTIAIEGTRGIYMCTTVEEIPDREVHDGNILTHIRSVRDRIASKSSAVTSSK